MKTILFCGGFGMRIRDYAENVPKPMIPVGGKPILWHLMDYYSQFDCKDFVLCLGYKSNVIKDFFLNLRPEKYADCSISSLHGNVQLLGEAQQDWRISMLDTGLCRNIGQRLLAVREQVQEEEVFLANYADALCDVDLSEMIEAFRNSGKTACFLATRPSFSMHFVDIDRIGRVRKIRNSETNDLWINGGFFIFRNRIFDFIREGEELVEEPFQRLIDADELLAFRHDGFWRPMDTLKDKQVLEDLVERGRMPWRHPQSSAKQGFSELRAG